RGRRPAADRLPVDRCRRPRSRGFAGPGLRALETAPYSDGRSRPRSQPTSIHAFEGLSPRPPHDRQRLVCARGFARRLRHRRELTPAPQILSGAAIPHGAELVATGTLSRAAVTPPAAVQRRSNLYLVQHPIDARPAYAHLIGDRRSPKTLRLQLAHLRSI